MHTKLKDPRFLNGCLVPLEKCGMPCLCIATFMAMARCPSRIGSSCHHPSKFYCLHVGTYDDDMWEIQYIRVHIVAMSNQGKV
jgi:hypothetical protein